MEMKRQSGLQSPRLKGILEQHKRAKRFLRLANKCKRDASRFTNLIAAIYPARSIVELMLEAVEKQELAEFKGKAQENRESFEGALKPKLPFYDLLEIIRIHDFHRFGCIPAPQKREIVIMQGPIKIRAGKGGNPQSAAPGGLNYVAKGNVSITGQRSLVRKNNDFFDEEKGEYVSLDLVLENFLSAVPETIKWFKEQY